MNYLLRDMDPKFWAKVKSRAALDQATVREVILKFLSEYIHAPRREKSK